MGKLTFLIFFFFCCQVLSAQTYTFNGNGNWSDSLNWLNSSKPPTPVLPNSVIHIQPVTGGQCIVNVPVTIPATASLNVTAGSQLVVLGNLTVLSNNSYGTRLKKVWQLYPHNAAYDTVGALIYSYDTQNRLIKRIDCEFEGSTSDTDYAEIATYMYHANDTLAYMKISQSNSLDIDPDTTFYTHYSNGNRASDSIVYRGVNTGYSVNHYVYDNDTIKVSSKYWYGSQNFQSRYVNVYQTKMDGNIIHQQDTGIFVQSNGATSIVSLHITSTYITNPNPFYPTMKGCRKLVQESELGMEADYTPKNLLTHQHKISSAQNLQETHSYLFRSDGYPFEAYVSTASESYKMVFEYE